MKSLTTEEFLKRAIAVHGSTYDYSLVDYMNGKINMEIICKKHGRFLQKPFKHLSGHGCRKCSDESQIGKYTDKLFFLNPSLKDKKSILYFIKVGNDCKIGITINSVKKRFVSFGLNYEILFEKSLPLYKAFLKEQYIIQKFSKGYKSNNIPTGKTECFPYSLELEKQILKEMVL